MMINDWKNLKSISPFVASFIESDRVQSFSDGKYDLGGGIILNVSTYKTDYRKNRLYESHKKYIDVQLVLLGEELITICNVDLLQIKQKYSENDDIILYCNTLEGKDILLRSGDFAIFGTECAHMPCICVNDVSTVKKAVFKIPVGEL